MSNKVEICKALGLETKNLLAVNVEILARGPITITAKYWTGALDAGAMVTALKQYQLKEINE